MCFEKFNTNWSVRCHRQVNSRVMKFIIWFFWAAVVWANMHDCVSNRLSPWIGLLFLYQTNESRPSEKLVLWQVTGPSSIFQKPAVGPGEAQWMEPPGTIGWFWVFSGFIWTADGCERWVSQKSDRNRTAREKKFIETRSNLNHSLFSGMYILFKKSVTKTYFLLNQCRPNIQYFWYFRFVCNCMFFAIFMWQLWYILSIHMDLFPFICYDAQEWFEK